MQMNAKPTLFRDTTHEGARATRATPMQALRRSVMSCLLWEDEFYEDGEEIAERIQKLAAQVHFEDLAKLAIEVRTEGKLRHVPLLLLACLVKWTPATTGAAYVVADAIANTIQRVDELTEFVSIYWKLNKDRAKGRKHAPFPAQMKKGLARAFLKFDAYQLAKYDRERDVRLRDVLRLCHAKPDTHERAALWKQLLEGTLPTPDTWEVALSSGADKGSTFERLIDERKLGYMALLRNLRNMDRAGVPSHKIEAAIVERRGARYVLPFRYVAAARAMPMYEPALDRAMISTIAESAHFPGRTVVLVDVSGSMDAKLSAKSDLTRMDAAATLASIINAESRRVFTFSDQLCEGAPRMGMAGVDAIKASQPHAGTNLYGALSGLILHRVTGNRLIVITDEQAGVLMSGARSFPEPAFQHRYMINVASARNGISYRPGWTHIDGFSESVLRFIAEYEKDAVQL